MDSKEQEKVELIVNQPIRSDNVAIVETTPQVEPLPTDVTKPAPYITPRASRLSKALDGMMAMVALGSIMKGRMMGGFRSPQTKKKKGLPSSARRRAIAKKKKLRKMAELARRNNRGVKGHTQMHRKG